MLVWKFSRFTPFNRKLTTRPRYAPDNAILNALRTLEKCFIGHAVLGRRLNENLWTPRKRRNDQENVR